VLLKRKLGKPIERSVADPKESERWRTIGESCI